MSQESFQPKLENIQQPTSTELLDKWSKNLERLSQEIESGAVQQKVPEWYKNSSESRELESSLQQTDDEPGNVSRWFELYTKEDELRSKITGKKRDSIDQAIYELGPDVLAKGFLAEQEDGPIHNALLNSLAEMVHKESGVAISDLQLLQKAYGTENFTQLFSIKGANYEAKIRNLLLELQIIGWISHKDVPEREEGSGWEGNQVVYRQWMSNALEAATGISHDEAMNYTFSASRGYDNQSLIDLIKRFDHFGADRIRCINKATGIVGLDAYSIEQLERMEKFATDPEGFAASLHDHDVSVLFTNRVGDDSGSLTRTTAAFDDTNKERMMFFEITTAADMLKFMSTLNKYDIKPSTLILSSHSNEGNFIVSDERIPKSPRYDAVTISGRGKVRELNGTENQDMNVNRYSMHGMKGFARVVENYMTSSRGIDDNPADLGRKKIIFSACEAASEVDYYNSVDGQVPVGTESVISQLGKDLIQSGVTSNVDIYGSSEGIQTKRTSAGVCFTTASREQVGEYWETVTRPAHTVRISINGGKFNKDEVSEIVLR